MSPSLNFQARFADAVESGEKRQTIRALRKDGRDPKVGDTLYLFTGMRTKACRRLGEVRCREVRDVVINEVDDLVTNGMWVGWHYDPLRSLRRFARADGFETFDEMRDWFRKTHGLPFVGKLYRWDKPL